MKKLSLSPRYYSSLDASWKEGVPASVMMTLTDYYVIPLGLLLGASAQQIGFLVAFPNLFASIAQLFAVKLVDLLGSRLRFLVKGVLLQAILLIPVAFLPFLDVPHKIEIFIGLIVLFRIIGNLIGTVWGSLASDYLPAEERGRYFGWRAQVNGISGIIGLGLGGVLLFALKNISPDFGFFILFMLTAVARFASGYFMSKMEDIPLQHKEGQFTFFHFLFRMRKSNFSQFVFFIAAITFSTFLAAPYFNVLMLRDLHFSYLDYTLVNLSAALAGLIGFPIWGKHADHVGNVRILRLTSFLLPLPPLLWLFSQNLIWLILVEGFSGFIWSGFTLCAVNFIFDSVAPEKRVRLIGYTNLIVGVAIFFGSALGGWLADRLPAIFGYQLCFLFLLSGLLRYVSYFFLGKRFEEIRQHTQTVKSVSLFFSVVGIKPILTGGSPASPLVDTTEK